MAFDVLGPINWLAGFITAIFVLLLTESYRDKKSYKKTQIFRLKDIKLHLQNYLSSYKKISINLGTFRMQNYWKEVFRSVHYQLLDNILSLYDDGIIDEATFEELLKIRDWFFIYSIKFDVDRYEEAWRNEIISEGEKSATEIQGMVESLDRIIINLENKKIIGWLPY